MSKQQYWVYMLRCSNGNFYTGYTTDIVRRYKEHEQGTAKCKYTRSFKPLGIAQCWTVTDCKGLVLQIEKFIKTLSKKEKEQLVLNPEKLGVYFTEAVVQGAEINATKLRDLRLL